MSMEHKGFIFDSDLYKILEKEIIKAVKKNDNESLYNFINEHLDECSSPYSEEELDEGWQDELESEDTHELCDFALTYCYDITDDQGLSYSWDALLCVMKQLNWPLDVDCYVLGNNVSYGDFVIDPGGMGAGFVEKKDIKKMNSELLKNKEKFIEKIKTVDFKKEKALYEYNENDLKEAYETLLSLYSSALDEKKGLFFTF